MYTKLYLQYLNFLKLKKNIDPTFNASCIVFLSQCVHFFLGMLILSKLFDFKISSFSSDNSSNRLFFMPVAAIWLYLVHKTFSAKSKKVDFKKEKIYELNNLQFLILVVVTILIPLYFIIILSGGQIWK